MVAPMSYLVFTDMISVGERSTIFPGKRQCVRGRSRCSPLAELSRDDNDAAATRAHPATDRVKSCAE